MNSSRIPRFKILVFTLRCIAVAASVVMLAGLICPLSQAQAPVPLINLPLVPGAASPGGAGFLLTINGTGFAPGAIVQWNSSPRPTTVVSNSQLTAEISAADIKNAGTAVVSVSNPSAVSNVVFFPVAKSTANAVAFTSPTILDAGTDPNSVAVGDFNHDGNLDLAVANTYSGNISIFLGDGANNFTLASSPSAGSTPSGIAVGDFNGDGNLDLAVANTWTGTVTILLGDGKGTFTLAASAAVGSWPLSVAVGDFNGDGKLDLAVANYYGSTESILLGDGTGNFTLVASPATGGLPAAAALGDFNRDGHLDLAVVGCGSSVTVLLGDGRGNFSSMPAITVDGCPLSVAAGDFNRDGNLDLVVAGGPAEVLLGDGKGNFKLTSPLPSGSGPRAVALGDFNADGNLDLAVANSEDETASILLGDGMGNFTLASSPPTGGGFPWGMAVGDFNRDGKMDIAVPDFDNVTVSILLNNSVGSQISTSTLLSSTPNPSTYGQAVELTATVTSSSGTPTGTVQLLNGSSVVASGTLASGSVTIPSSSLPAGSNSVVAFYLGDVGFAPSKSTAVTQVVAKSATSSSLAASVNPVATNQTLTLTATVSSQYGGAVTGAVTFVAGSQTLGSASLSGNSASLTTSFANAGNYQISAKYSGDSNNKSSPSAPITETVMAATTTVLASSLNPAFTGQSITFTATVAASSGTPPNGEVITFSNGSAILGTAALSGGVAVLTMASLPAGIYSVTARYPGDSTFAASTSTSLRQVVNSTTKSATLTVLASNINPAVYGQKIMLTATVTTSAALPPTGIVVFQWTSGLRTFTVGTVAVASSGVATLTTLLNAAIYPMKAVYRGDINNLPSTSAMITQTVQPTTSKAMIASSLNPSAAGQPVTFYATITSPTVTPTGPVTFKLGTTVLGMAQLISGKASITTSSLPAGSNVVKVIYSGDSNIAKSSAALTQVVQP